MLDAPLYRKWEVVYRKREGTMRHAASRTIGVGLSEEYAARGELQSTVSVSERARRWRLGSSAVEEEA